MKEIKLTQGKIALVDDCDYERVSQFKWHAVKYPKKNGICWYAKRHEYVNGKQIIIRMHNFILGHDPLLSNMEVDHIDRNGLNNTRSNIRIVTKSDNARNRNTFQKRSGKFKGCYYDKHQDKYRCSIVCNGKHIFLGRYKTIEECAKRYDLEAVKLFKDRAVLNYPTI